MPKRLRQLSCQDLTNLIGAISNREMRQHETLGFVEQLRLVDDLVQMNVPRLAGIFDGNAIVEHRAFKQQQASFTDIRLNSQDVNFCVTAVSNVGDLDNLVDVLAGPRFGLDRFRAGTFQVGSKFLTAFPYDVTEARNSMMSLEWRNVAILRELNLGIQADWDDVPGSGRAFHELHCSEQNMDTAYEEVWNVVVRWFELSAVPPNGVPSKTPGMVCMAVA